MKTWILLLLTITHLNLLAQENLSALTSPIVAEGKWLYRSEMASWYGTDLFLEKYLNRDRIGGYLSYPDGPGATCIFFSKEEAPRVLGTIHFDSTYKLKTATTDLQERPFTTYERDLFTIRSRALAAINGDTLFKSYPNTSLNLIPFIDARAKKVYVLTGPKQKGVVVFGNDYLLRFDENNNLVSKKQLHRNIIPVDTRATAGKEIEGSMHVHLPETGDFITATDICTLMLYERFTGWKQHNVISKNYLNIWNCKTNELLVLPMATVKKIAADQEARKAKKSD